jgi:DNA-binding NarL/FixJ family response regulator
MAIQVIITDDHPIVANGVKTVLDRIPTITVAGIYHSAPELLQNIARVKPDVLLLDKQLQQTDALETVRALIRTLPRLQILIFSSNDTLYHVKQMLEAGCRGYLLKDADDDMLINAIETVFEGRRFLSPALEKALQEELSHPNGNKKVHLTKREKEVMELIVKEYTNPEIAAKLFLSPSTIESHRTSILHKLGVKNTAGLVRVAFETGLV